MMFTPEELEEHRADAESLMRATLRGYAPTNRSEQNETSGREERVWDDKGTTAGKLPGISKVSLDARIFDVNVEGQDVVKFVTSLHVPLRAYVDPTTGALQITPGWEFVCEGVAAGMDPAHVGRRWRVVGVPIKDYATARRLDVEEV